MKEITLFIAACFKGVFQEKNEQIFDLMSCNKAFRKKKKDRVYWMKYPLEILLLFSTIFCVVSSGTSLTPPSQTQALIDLYRATNGQNWIVNGNWLKNDQPCSNWVGVTCDAAHNIARLDLPSNNLVGSLPESLRQMRNLQTLFVFRFFSLIFPF